MIEKEQYKETAMDRSLENLFSEGNTFSNILTAISIIFTGGTSALGLLSNIFLIDDGPEVTRTRYVVSFVSEEKEYSYFGDGYVVIESKNSNTVKYRIGAGEVNGGAYFDDSNIVIRYVIDADRDIISR